MQKLLNDSYRKAKIGLQIVNPDPSKWRPNSSNYNDHGLKPSASVTQEEESPVSLLYY